MSKQFFELHIKGKVQGVWYRKTCADQARLLNVTGFVQNMKDGSVYCEAEGGIDQLIDFIAWCEVGPPDAQVSEILKVSGAPKNYTSFEIKRF